MTQNPQQLSDLDTVSISERVDAAIAAIPPPVTRHAIADLAAKAQAAAAFGPEEDRAEWLEIAREFERRVVRFRP